MFTDKIDYEVGQAWEDKLGNTIMVGKIVMDCMQASNGFWYGPNGQCRSIPERDLVGRASPAAKPAAASAAPAPTTVGDINSQAKGAGARYNAGKPPFDLVPLQMMAEYYACVENSSGFIDFDPILALSWLGEFQGGGDSEDLIKTLLHLGDGWEECAQVFGYGRKKYAAWNWSKGMAWSVPIACAARHLQAMICGEQIDPESGLPHRGHVFCNIAMLFTFGETYPEGDDRAPAGSLMMSLEDEDEDEDGPIIMDLIR